MFWLPLPQRRRVHADQEIQTIAGLLCSLAQTFHVQLSQHLVICLFFFRDFCFPPPHRNCFICSLYSSPRLFFIWGVRGIHSVWASGISIFSICLPVPIFVFLRFIFLPLCLCPSLAAYVETEDATMGCRREKKFSFIIIDLFFILRTSGTFWFAFTLLILLVRLI